jgi:HEAT repeat protein
MVIANWTEDLKRRAQALPAETSTAALAALGQLVAEGVSSSKFLEDLLLDSNAKEELRSKGAWLSGVLLETPLIGTLEALVREETPKSLLWEASKALVAMDCRQQVFVDLLLHGKDSEARRVAAFALGSLREKSAAPTLIAIVSSQNEPANLRGQAAEALGYIGDKESVVALLGATQDSDPSVRFWAVFALGEIGDPQARGTLEKLAESDHEKVEGWWEISKEAQAALKRLSPG